MFAATRLRGNEQGLDWAPCHIIAQVVCGLGSVFVHLLETKSAVPTGCPFSIKMSGLAPLGSHISWITTKMSGLAPLASFRCL